jgi:hypothetical protein
MTNREKNELRKLAKERLPFIEIRKIVNCSDATIRAYIKIFKSIGIAAKRAFADLEIEIMYKDKYGNRVFPAKYFITKEKIITYPYRYIGGNRIYIVPIKDLTIKEK